MFTDRLIYTRRNFINTEYVMFTDRLINICSAFSDSEDVMNESVSIKKYKLTCARIEDLDKPAHLRSGWSL